MRIAQFAVPAMMIAVASLASARPAAGACEAPSHLAYSVPVEVEGVLAAGKGNHEAQGEFSYTYLALDQGVCVDAPAGDEFAQSTPRRVTRVQIAGEAAEKELPVGKRVKVKGTLFGGHTMWHAEDVLIDAAVVEAQ
jgi:hypothetical protein